MHHGYVCMYQEGRASSTESFSHSSFGFHIFRTFTFTPIRLVGTIRFLLTGVCIICTSIVRASHSHHVGRVGDLQGGCDIVEVLGLLGISWHVVITMGCVAFWRPWRAGWSCDESSMPLFWSPHLGTCQKDGPKTQKRKWYSQSNDALWLFMTLCAQEDNLRP